MTIMRSLSGLALLASLTGVVWAGRELVLALQAPPRALPLIENTFPVPDVALDEKVSPPFLAIFGSVYETARAQPASAAEAFRLPYLLKGLIVVGDVRWAVLSHDDGDLVVQEGEDLGDGVTVRQVRAEGIELATADGLMILGFDADTPVAMAEVAAVQDLSDSTGPKGNFNTAPTAAVLFQDMTSDEILAALERAEERRIARGWVAPSDEAE